MARLNTRLSATPAARSSTVDSLYRDPTPLHPNGGSTARQSSYSVMSPGVGPNSDKENDIPPSREETPQLRSRGKTMAYKHGARPPTPDSGSTSSRNANKRRRTDNYSFDASEFGSAPVYDGEAEEDVQTSQDNGEPQEQNRGPPTPVDDEDDESLKYYNPNQDPTKRRAVVVGINKHGREIADNYDELVNGDGEDIIRHINKLNIHMGKVRQTADAAKDSRLLGTVAEITGKALNMKTQARAGVGIDLDQFVSRCIYYMKRGHAPNADDEGTPASHRRQTQHVDDDDDDIEESVEGLDWAYLGRNVCFATNRRPPTSSFLLGPLSLQKRVRSVQTRRARVAREPLGPATRPQELRQEDIKQSENSNLTHLVKDIKDRLGRHIETGSKRIEAELTELGDDYGEEDFDAACNRHRVHQTPDDEAAVSLFDFVLNPDSFGQSVENLFYMAFLIREGNAKVLEDKNGLPLVVPASSRNVEEHRQHNIEKHQAIFSLDYQTWRELVEAFDITEPLIPHRVAAEANLAPGGWYG